MAEPINTSQTEATVVTLDLKKLQKQFMKHIRVNDFDKCNELYQQLKTVNFGNSHCDIGKIAEELIITNNYSKYVVTNIDNFLANCDAKHTENPLITMSVIGNLDAVIFLVEKLDADVNYLSIDKTTAIMYAFQKGNIDIVVYLLSKGALTKIKGLTWKNKMTDFADQKQIRWQKQLQLK